MEIYKKGSLEYRRLKRAADKLAKASPTHKKYFVTLTRSPVEGELWTTIMCTTDFISFWPIDPEYRSRILSAENDDELWVIVNDLLLDPRCPDHL